MKPKKSTAFKRQRNRGVDDGFRMANDTMRPLMKAHYLKQGFAAGVVAMSVVGIAAVVVSLIVEAC